MGGHGALTLGVAKSRSLPNDFCIRAHRESIRVPLGRKGVGQDTSVNDRLAWGNYDATELVMSLSQLAGKPDVDRPGLSR